MGDVQCVLVFAKLVSFQKAAKRVRSLLEQVVEDDDQLNGKVIVKKYKGGDKWPTDDFATTTVVVVIDARQSRVCLVQSRRDSSIDHRAELDMLYKTSTKPKGSILVVIYGDSQSENMSDDKLVADKWIQTWKFNDKVAQTLVQRSRLFSISDNFNAKQVAVIVDYLYKLPLIPIHAPDSNVLVIGKRDPLTEEAAELRRDPFLTDHIVQHERQFTVQESKYISLVDGQCDDASGYLRTYFVDDLATPKVCDLPDGQKIDLLTTKDFKDCGIDNMMGFHIVQVPRVLWFNRFPKFDQVLLVPHCGVCFCRLTAEQDRIGQHLKSALSKLGIQLSPNARVLPLMTTGCQEPSVRTKALAFVDDAIEKDANLTDESKTALKRQLGCFSEDDSFIWDLYTMHMYNFQPGLKPKEHRLGTQSASTDQNEHGHGQRKEESNLHSEDCSLPMA